MILKVRFPSVAVLDVGHGWPMPTALLSWPRVTTDLAGTTAGTGAGAAGLWSAQGSLTHVRDAPSGKSAV